MQTPNSLAAPASSRHKRLARIAFSGLPLFAALFAAAVSTLNADTISNNLTNVSGGTETVTGVTWLTASFGTGTSSAALDTVTLLLANSTAGTAEVDLYSDGLLAPGSVVAQLTPATTYSTTLMDTSFTANGVTLAANSTYWIVLKATTGAFEWSWTTDNTGTGIGYQGTWGSSTDRGTTWFTYAVYPTQFSVTTAAAVTPEPGTWMLSAGGLLMGGALLRKKQRAYGQAEGERL